MRFTSEDIDFKGGHADVQRIARQLELAPGYPPKVQMTALAGFIPFHIGDLKSAIEVVRRIPGISDAHTPAIQADWNGIAELCFVLRSVHRREAVPAFLFGMSIALVGS